MMRMLMLLLAGIFMILPMQTAGAANFSERAAHMGEVRAIRINAESDKVRIVADVGREVDYETSVVENPQRIVVDLHGAWLGPDVTKKIEVDSRFVKQVRVAQFDADTVRVVVESNIGKNNYDVFSLEGGSVPYRVVMDLGNLGKSGSNGATIDFSGETIKAKQEKDRAEAERKKAEAEKKRLEAEQKKAEAEKKKAEEERITAEQNRNSTEGAPSGQQSIDNSKNTTSGTETVRNDTVEKEKPAPVVVEPTFTPGISGKKICIDAGHGGSDVGAIGPTGVTEKSVTFRVAKDVEELLTKEGAEVIMTRRIDTEVSPKKTEASDIEELQARCDVANNAGADIFLSLHMDSFTNSTPSGTTGYYYSSGTKAGQRLAKTVADSIVGMLKTNNRGSKSCNFYVVKHTNMPATLIEMAFISNDKEEKLMNSEAGIKKAATAIVEGIRKFFG